MADSNSGLQVVDISNPLSPHIIGSVDTPDWAKGIYVSGDYAYVADGDSGLQVIDISNPSNPSIIGSVDTPGHAYDAFISGSYAYIADYLNGLQVIDISDPLNPKIIGSIDTPDHAYSVYVSGNYAYVADFSSGLQVIDISNPSSPVIIGSVDTPGIAMGVYVSGSYAYVADEDGLVIVPIPVEIIPVTVNSDTSITVILPSALFAGHYDLRVFNDTEYDELLGAVSFAESLPVRKAIIVAGGGPYEGNWIWEETDRCADYAYKALLYQGYRRENIYYLSPDNVDVDGNGILDDVDGDASYNNLSFAINNWVMDSKNPADELLIYMVDHGSDETFNINDDEPEPLNAEELDLWLDTLQTTLPGKVIFIYDACLSGTFISSLKPPEGKEGDRIIITASRGDERSVFLQDGKISFSYQFWDKTYDGSPLAGAYDHGSDMMERYQTACLDANGDGLVDETDDAIEGVSICRGFVPASDIPFINMEPESRTLQGETTLTIQASSFIDINGISKVWAIITPPDYDPGFLDTPVTDFPTIELTDPEGDNTYVGDYSFTSYGTYDVTIYAMDTNENISLPVYITVYQSGGIDVYEEDDTYTQAGIIVLDNKTPQHHNFHDAGDFDWVKFYGTANEIYSIEATDLGEKCDIVMELYDSTGTNLLYEQDSPGDPQADEIIEWECPSDGVYYVKIKQYKENSYGIDTGYSLNIHHPSGGIPGWMMGIVLNSIGQGIANAVITSSISTQGAITNSTGFYKMLLPSGTHTMSITASGYDSQNMEVVLDNYTNRDFEMTSLTDSDDDGLIGDIELMLGTDPNDADTDDDGIIDGDEDADHDGIVDSNETNPTKLDTDVDGIQDGTEQGYTLIHIDEDTDKNIFQPDLDPSTTTNPLKADTDNDGKTDGQEDKNYNGKVDEGESDPNVEDFPWELFVPAFTGKK
jgi:hypothetical protein